MRQEINSSIVAAMVVKCVLNYNFSNSQAKLSLDFFRHMGSLRGLAVFKQFEDVRKAGKQR